MGQMVEGRWSCDDVSHVEDRFQRQALLEATNTSQFREVDLRHPAHGQTPDKFIGAKSSWEIQLFRHNLTGFLRYQPPPPLTSFHA